MLKDSDKLCGYCHILPPASNTANQTSISTVNPAIGRVLITADHRGQKLAQPLMTQAIDYRLLSHSFSKPRHLYISADVSD